MITTKEDIVEVDALTFYEKFKWHKEHNTIKHTEQVLLRSLEHYTRECFLFLMTKDYSAGLAMEKSGRIISVFKGNTKYVGVGKVLLDLAIARGGCKLECNDVQMLRYIYGRNGFVPVSTSPLDENDIYYTILKANEDDENHGTRLIFWIFDKGLKEKYDSNNGEVHINFSQIKEFNTEDEAEEFRDSILQNICNPTEELKEYILKIIDDYIFSSK